MNVARALQAMTLTLLAWALLGLSAHFKSLRDRPQLRAANQLCPQLVVGCWMSIQIAP